MVILHFTSSAQITVTQSQVQDMWGHPGNKVEFYWGTGSMTVNIGNTGGPNIYDFSTDSFKLKPKKVYKVSEIPELLGRFPDSAVTFSDSSQSVDNNVFLFLPDTMLTLGHAYISVASDTQRYIHFAPPCLDFGIFPVGYGETWSYSTTSYETTYVRGSMIGTKTYTWSNNVTVDGYGTLRIPGHDFQCLRGKGVAGNDKIIVFFTREGAMLWINTPTSQPDTGNINANFYAYILGSSLVNGVNEQIIPSDFQLQQNYPNPFNPTTKIQYAISSAQFVTLKIYDLLGREITTLINERKQAGSYEVNFSGDNLTSGVYFYRIQAGSFSETKKLVLIR
jgi:hypothetical protein